MTRALVVALIATSGVCVVLDADGYECARAPAVDRPKIGLVLGGGGARGAAHIGVIKVLEELRVPVDYVTGTSMGSLVGGFYATGMSAKTLDETLRGIDFDELFRDSTSREDLPFRRKQDDDLALFGPKLGIGKDSQLLSRGAVHGQKITFLFETLTSSRVQTTDFDELPIPYRAVAADIVTGETVVIGQGNLGVAMRASMSVPGAFDPVEIGDRLLVDGGIANNLPIDVARSLGADVVIAVDVGTPLETREDLKTMVNFTSQLSGLLVVRNSKAQIATLTADDVLVAPPLGTDISAAGFEHVAKAIDIGYKAADKMRERLAPFSISDAAYAEHRRYIEACVKELPPVQFVRIDNRSRFSDEVLARRVKIPIGEPLDRERLEHEIRQIYALGFIDLARYEIVEEDGRTGIVIHVNQDARGTTFLEWGLDVFTDGDDADVNLRLAALKTDVDDYGSEARLLAQIGETPSLGAELYKSVFPDQSLFLYPKVFVERRDLTTFDDRGNEETQIAVDQWGGQVALVHEFGRYATVLGGVRKFSGQVSLEFGDPTLDEFEFDGGEYFVELTSDRINDRYFPSHGTLFAASYLASSDALGADDDYEQVALRSFTAMTYGAHTLIGGIRYSTTLDNDAPVYAIFRAGGLFNLSGVQPNELSGQHFGGVLASYRYDLGGGSGSLFPAYVGMSAEYGNATDDRSDVFGDGIANGSLYFGYRSPAGPLYWGMGFAEGGQRTYFLRIGNVFGTSSIGR